MPADFTHHFIRSEQQDSPLLVLLHGTGGDETSLIQLGAELLPGAHLLGIKGRVSENGMPRFFKRLAEGVFDLEDLAVRTEELCQFIGDFKREKRLVTNKIVAVGYSNGANIAANILLTKKDVLDGAILFRAMLPQVPPSLPQNAKTPVLLLSGETDVMVPPQSAEMLTELLRQSGAEVEHVWQRTGHRLVQRDVDAAKEWLQKST
jgi:predicted esterase